MNIQYSSITNFDRFFTVVILSSLLLLSACGGGSDKAESVQISTNKAPNVNAGEDQTVSANENVRITASASDSDGTISSYSWSQISGVGINLVDSDSANASFVAPTEAGQANILVSFRVTATDNGGSSATDTVTITINQPVTNVPPNINAGQDQSVQEGGEVSLSAVASDNDGSIQSYRWSQLSGTSVSINSASSANASFSAPLVPDGQSQITLSFQILVTDNSGATSTDSIDITVNTNASNIAPSVNAGNDQLVQQQDSVQLTATASDSDGSITSYAWSQTSGNQINLSNPSSNNASFIAPDLQNSNTSESYSFDITVTDNEGLQSSDSITVTVEPPQEVGQCTTTISAGQSVTNTLNGMNSGDTLCLNDGLYTQGISVPSGLTVKAVNQGGAEFRGGDSGWSSVFRMAGSGATVDGLKIHYPDNTTSNACSISGTNNTMKNTTCSHGGTYKHVIPLIVAGSGHLIEDSWFYGEGRYVVQCFVGDHIIFRRNVARWDSTTPNEPTEPNAAFSIYNCSDMTVENNISLDYGTPQTPMEYGGDFYSPHNISVYPQLNHDNHWLGNMVVNHSTDTRNNRAFRADSSGGSTIPGGVIKDFYMRDVASDFVIKPVYRFQITDCTRINVNGDVSNISCTGADLTMRYQDRVKTSEPLFPWPNEARIKTDMCASGERQSDWCASSKSLSDYVLNQ